MSLKPEAYLYEEYKEIKPEFLFIFYGEHGHAFYNNLHAAWKELGIAEED